MPSILLSLLAGCMVPAAAEHGRGVDEGAEASGKADLKKSMEPWVFIDWIGNDAFRLVRRTKTAVKLGIEDYVQLTVRFKRSFTENYPRRINGKKGKGLLEAQLEWEFGRTGEEYKERKGVARDIVYFSVGRANGNTPPPMDGYMTLEDFVRRMVPAYKAQRGMTVVGHQFADGTFDLPEAPRNPLTMWVEAKRWAATILAREVLQDYDYRGVPLDHLNYPIDAYRPRDSDRTTFAIGKVVVKTHRFIDGWAKRMLDPDAPPVPSLDPEEFVRLHVDAEASTPLEAEAAASLFRAFVHYATRRYDPPAEGSWDEKHEICLEQEVGGEGGQWTKLSYGWYDFKCAFMLSVSLLVCPSCTPRADEWERF